MSKTIKFYKVNRLKDSDFKRVVGVRKETFKAMVKVVRKHYREMKSKGGRKKAMFANDETVMMLEYYREYRTFKHLGIDYEVSESTAHYIVTKIEKILIVNSQFHLEKLKQIVPLEDSKMIEVRVVDVTESECERPKKSRNCITQGKRKSIL
jgi:hypothetical protein